MGTHVGDYNCVRNRDSQILLCPRKCHLFQTLPAKIFMSSDSGSFDLDWMSTLIQSMMGILLTTPPAQGGKMFPLLIITEPVG